MRKNFVHENEEYNEEDESNDFWSKGSYIKTIDPNDSDFEERMKYFEEKSDEPKDYKCKKCNKPIGKHNLYWHEGMCDGCFFDEHDM